MAQSPNPAPAVSLDIRTYTFRLSGMSGNRQAPFVLQPDGYRIELIESGG